MNETLAAAIELALEAVPKIVAAVLALIVALGVWRVLGTLGAHVAFDPNEGWNAYHAAAAMSGRALYPPPQSYFINNYPPLSFYLVGALGSATHDNIIAGRIISLFSFLAIAGGIWQAARLMRCSDISAITAILFFMICLLVGSDYVGMDDPQLLAHALEIGALVVLLQPSENNWLAALLFVIAVFVKHNLVAMPLAVTVWFAIYDRDRAIRFVAAGLVFALVGLAAFHWIYGGGLPAHLTSARTYSFALLIANASDWLVWGAVPVLVVGALVALHREDEFVIFCALYAGLSIAIGVALSGGAGVDTNVFFDADIALALGVGLAIDRFDMRSAWRPAAISAALLLPLAVGLYLRADEDWRDPDYWAHPMSEEDALSRSDIVFLASHPGPALCETLALCYWANKPAEVDTFNAGEAIATGSVSDAPLIQKIQSRAYAVMEFDTMEPFALGPRVHAAVLAAYRVDHTNDDGVFLVPNTPEVNQVSPVRKPHKKNPRRHSAQPSPH